MSTANTVALLEIDMVGAALRGQVNAIRRKEWFDNHAVDVASNVLNLLAAQAVPPPPALMNVLCKVLSS